MPTESGLAGALLAVDRRISLLLGRAVRDAERRAGRPLQSLIFWSLAGLHSLLWWIICRSEGQPEWTWFLLGTGAGLFGGYLLAREPVATLDDGLAHTAIGLDGRWAAFRLAYLPIVAIALAPLLGKPGPLLLWLIADALTVAVLEYLLTFRVLQPGERPLDQRMAAVFGQLSAAPPDGAPGPSDDDGEKPATEEADGAAE